MPPTYDQAARRDALAKRARLRQPAAAAEPRGVLAPGNSSAVPEQLLTMLNQLTPDRRQRAVDYVAQLLELQRAQDGPQAQPAPGANRGAGRRVQLGLPRRDLAAAAPLKPALHVSGHMAGYNAAEPTEKLADQVAQLSDTLSRLQPPHQQEALDHMVGNVFPPMSYPPPAPPLQPPSPPLRQPLAQQLPQWPPPQPQWPQAPPSQSQWPQAPPSQSQWPPPPPAAPQQPWQRAPPPQQLAPSLNPPPPWAAQPAAGESVYSMARNPPALQPSVNPITQPYAVPHMRSTEVRTRRAHTRARARARTHARTHAHAGASAPSCCPPACTRGGGSPATS